MKLLLLLISFSGFLAAQAQNETLIPANPPTGVGGACSATTYGYMQALTGGDRVVVCDPVTHLWTVLGSGGGGGTIPSTTSALKGDGAGNAAAVTGTGSNCVHVDGSSASCGGTGDVVGPGSATDNAVARFDSTTGKLIQNSAATVDDSGNLTAASLSTGASAPSVTGTGVLAMGETTGQTCAASAVDCIKADSTQHGFLSSFNNGSFLPLVQGPASQTTGRVASWNGTNGGLLADAGFLAADVVRAVSPGAGICHFAGSTQVCTSSLIVAADITSATITGAQIASSIALAGSPTTTTQSVSDNSTKIATTAYVDAQPAPSLKSASTTVSVSAATAPSSGQVLTATDSTHATWQTPSGGSSSCPASYVIPGAPGPFAVNVFGATASDFLVSGGNDTTTVIELAMPCSFTPVNFTFNIPQAAATTCQMEIGLYDSSKSLVAHSGVVTNATTVDCDTTGNKVLTGATSPAATGIGTTFAAGKYYLAITIHEGSAAGTLRIKALVQESATGGLILAASANQQGVLNGAQSTTGGALNASFTTGSGWSSGTVNNFPFLVIGQ